RRGWHLARGGSWREIGIGETVDGFLAERTIDAGLEIEGEQLRDGGGELRRGGRHRVNLRRIAPSRNAFRWLSSRQKSETTGKIRGVPTGPRQDHEQRRVTPA